MTALAVLLRVAAAAQAAVALLNLTLPRVLGWRPDLARLPRLVREVFYVHAGFISLTLAIFAVLTWRFAPDLARGDDELAAWLAAGIGVFWGVRTAVQVLYYSASHWRGRRRETVAHVTLLAVYGGMTTLYLLAALG